MPTNQYNAPRKPEIERLDRDDIIQVILDKRLTEKLTDFSIMKWLCYESGYNYGTTYAYQLIKDTNDYVRELNKTLAKHTLDDCLSELYADRQAAISRGDNRLAFDILKEIDKIAGHYKEKIEINQDVTFKVKWGS